MHQFVFMCSTSSLFSNLNDITCLPQNHTSFRNINEFWTTCSPYTDVLMIKIYTYKLYSLLAIVHSQGFILKHMVYMTPGKFWNMCNTHTTFRMIKAVWRDNSTPQITAHTKYTTQVHVVRNLKVTQYHLFNNATCKNCEHFKPCLQNV